MLNLLYMEELKKKQWKASIVISIVNMPLIIIVVATWDPFLLLIGMLITIPLQITISKKFGLYKTPDVSDEMVQQVNGWSSYVTMRFVLLPIAFIGLLLYVSGDRWWPWAEHVGLAMAAVSLVFIFTQVALASIRTRRMNRP